MTLTIVGDIDASQNMVQLSGDLDAQPGDLFRLDDEVVTFGGHLALDRQHAVSLSLVSLARGQEGTDAASHDDGTELLGAVEAVVSNLGTTRPAPFPSGGIITVGDSVALPIFVGNLDPTLDPDTSALVIPGALWMDTTFGPPYQQQQRNDDTWVSIGSTFYDGDGNVMLASSIGGGGNYEIVSNDTLGTPLADFSVDFTDSKFVHSSDGEIEDAGFHLTAAGTSIINYIPPTSDPLVVGALWNNAGTLTISTG